MRTKPEKPTSIAAKGARTAAERGDRVEKRENTALWPIEPSRKIECFPYRDSSSGVRPDIPPEFSANTIRCSKTEEFGNFSHFEKIVKNTGDEPSRSSSNLHILRYLGRIMG